MSTVLTILSYAIVVIVFLFVGYKTLTDNSENKREWDKVDDSGINENSFQRYAKFYGEIYPHEDGFNEILDKIKNLIIDKNMTDIREIAKEVPCSIPECVMKIKYLENQQVLKDIYVDTNNLKIISCSDEDELLLKKYRPYLYGSHKQIDEFVNLVPNPKRLRVDEHKQEILEEIKYLDKKGLLNGIKIDDIDGTIIYYAIENKKAVYNKETVHCPNCGALNDVELTGKVRCGYCKSIVMGSKAKEVNEES